MAPKNSLSAIMVRERKNKKSSVETVDAIEKINIDDVDEVPKLNSNGREHVNGKQLNGQKLDTPEKTTPKKKQQVNDEEAKIPLGERERKISGSLNGKRQNSAMGGSQCILLTQGIMANDTAKIDSVLRNLNTDSIQATLRDLQPMQVLPLLKIIENRLKTRRSNDIRPIIRWAQVAFSVHMPYLCSLPNLEKEIGGLLGWLKSRVDHQRELLALHGKISTLADQIKRKTNKVVLAHQPLIVFNNDLDSDSDDFEDPGSDEDGENSEDDWWEESELKGDEDDDNENDENSDEVESSDDEEQAMNGIESSDSGSSEEENDEEMEIG